MKTFLLRHGQVNITDNHPVTAKKLINWINHYNNSGVKLDCLPPAKTRELAQNCNLIVCSDYSRSIESANILGVKTHHIDPIFREAGLPYANWESIKLKPSLWAILLWLTGYRPNYAPAKPLINLRILPTNRKQLCW